MNETDPLAKILAAWQPKNPHPLPKFVNDTMRMVRLLDQRPWWRVWTDGFSERLDILTAEWLPAPRALVPVAAALIVLITAIEWTRVDSDASHLAALRWKQSVSVPVDSGSLSGAYVRAVTE